METGIFCVCIFLMKKHAKLKNYTEQYFVISHFSASAASRKRKHLFLTTSVFFFYKMDQHDPTVICILSDWHLINVILKKPTIFPKKI